MLVGQANALAMTTRQLFRLSMFSAAIDRANGVDHVLCGKASAGSDHGLSGGQASNLAHNLPAFSEDRRTARVVNGVIDSASAQKR